MSGPGEDATEIAELSVIKEDMTDEEIMMLAGTLSSLAKMMLVEVGLMDDDQLDPNFIMDHKQKMH